MEYRKSLAVPIDLCFTAGWLGVLRLGKKQEEIVAMLSETSDLDIEGSKVWKDRHHELFTNNTPMFRRLLIPNVSPWMLNEYLT
ncbi:hypothetical protein Tco_1047452 [Tanacetum coccineum]